MLCNNNMAIITFYLCDNFNWDNYKTKVYKDIINVDNPVEVIWDLRGMTNIPSFSTLMKQFNLMKKEKESIKKNIIKNSVIVSSQMNRDLLLWCFKYFYSPQNPTLVFTVDEWDSLR